ncbi:hypothetical protein [uncultured Jatrophihabitans sp.]|uniref:hypothetical protein n=1 Tax=uncultured Jatrophihabitans sp. TaxID=1610747 RepID=UPI0035CA085A
MTDPQWQQSPTPYYTPPGYHPSTATPPPPPPPPPRQRNGSPLLWTAVVIALVIGVAVGYVFGDSRHDNKGTATAAATTDDSPSILASAPAEPTDTPTEEPSPTTPNLAPSDFTIKLRVRSKECFGSAGCDLTYQIDPQYNGIEDISSGSWEVTYVVRGGQDGPQVNTFTLKDGQASFDDSESIQTTSSGTKLRAKVTSVEVES